jgi:hypothetical protein
LALQGSLDTFSLPDVLRLLATTTKTGRLRLEGDRGQGNVWLRDGSVVDAVADRAVEGAPTEEVIFELLRFERGSFAFESDEGTPDAGHPEEVEGLLRRAGALLSEWTELEAVVPSLDHRVALASELPSDEVTIDSDRWRSVVAVATARSVGDLAGSLDLSELNVSRAVRDLVELGVANVEGPGAPTVPDEAPRRESRRRAPRPPSVSPNGAASRPETTVTGDAARAGWRRASDRTTGPQRAVPSADDHAPPTASPPSAAPSAPVPPSAAPSAPVPPTAAPSAPVPPTAAPSAPVPSAPVPPAPGSPSPANGQERTRAGESRPRPSREASPNGGLPRRGRSRPPGGDAAPTSPPPVIGPDSVPPAPNRTADSGRISRLRNGASNRSPSRGAEAPGPFPPDSVAPGSSVFGTDPSPFERGRVTPPPAPTETGQIRPVSSSSLPADMHWAAADEGPTTGPTTGPITSPFSGLTSLGGDRVPADGEVAPHLAAMSPEARAAVQSTVGNAGGAVAGRGPAVGDDAAQRGRLISFLSSVR